MKRIYDLSELDWKLSGWTPEMWRMRSTAELGLCPDAEVPSLPASVPSSVQGVLRDAGVIPDWNIGLNSRLCEWVENRHWIYGVTIPDEWFQSGLDYRLECQGLDYSGSVLVNGSAVSTFCGSQVPHVFDITDFLEPKGNTIWIVFDCPPRWLGQFGRTSAMTAWKPRFNYTWDWTPRIVQIGIWDSVSLIVSDAQEIKSFRCYTDFDTITKTGTAIANAEFNLFSRGFVELTLEDGDCVIKAARFSTAEFDGGVVWTDLAVKSWWPNGLGCSKLYCLVCRLLDEDGNEVDRVERRIGFKNIEWKSCEGAPEEADHWICYVNDHPVFLQGVNWTPIRPNFADVKVEDYRQRLEIYKDIGFNILRVWGGAFLENKCFYDICDELGLMVWQEFPMSSSGFESCPPADALSIAEMEKIAYSFVCRRQHHVSLIMWGGGNELESSPGVPVGIEHALIRRLAEVVQELDPGKRFVPSSASGPSSFAQEENYGKGIHWDVHGPWKACDMKDWERYWAGDDSLFRSEVGAPGASPAEMIHRYSGDYDPFPCSNRNVYWRHPMPWWIEWEQYVGENGCEPESLEDYVDWSQYRQSKALTIALRSAKMRFPQIGGMIIWMGHDSYPMPANTSIIDFDGNPKPAALALREFTAAHCDWSQ